MHFMSAMFPSPIYSKFPRTWQSNAARRSCVAGRATAMVARFPHDSGFVDMSCRGLGLLRIKVSRSMVWRSLSRAYSVGSRRLESAQPHAFQTRVGQSHRLRKIALTVIWQLRAKLAYGPQVMLVLLTKHNQPGMA